MDKQIKYSMLIKYYGGLLTEKQYDIMELHYEFDTSLGEIAENFNVSRQSIMGTIHKAQKSLDKYEQKIGFLRKIQYVENILMQIKDDKNKSQIDDIIKVLKE